MSKRKIIGRREDGFAQTVGAFDTSPAADPKLPAVVTCESTTRNEFQRLGFNYQANFTGNGFSLTLSARGKCPLRPGQQITLSAPRKAKKQKKARR